MQKSQLIVALFGGLVMASTASFAQNTTTPTPAPAAATAPQAAPQDDPNEVVCRTGQPQLGSRFPGPRECHTRREWAQIQRDSQDALMHQQMERSANGGH